MGKCFIVGAGEFNDYFEPQQDDLVIAADGGYDSLMIHGIRCDLLVGDLDSVECLPKDMEIIRYPVKKDETDMHLAFILGYERGYREFVIFGGGGGRADHTFANYCLLYNMELHGCEGVMISEQVHTRIMKNKKITFSSADGAGLSVFAFDGEARGVSITGAKYEARDIVLKSSFPLGVSNSFTEVRAEVQVNDGALLVIWEQR